VPICQRGRGLKSLILPLPASGSAKAESGGGNKRRRCHATALRLSIRRVSILLRLVLVMNASVLIRVVPNNILIFTPLFPVHLGLVNLFHLRRLAWRAGTRPVFSALPSPSDVACSSHRIRRVAWQRVSGEPLRDPEHLVGRRHADGCLWFVFGPRRLHVFSRSRPCAIAAAAHHGWRSAITSRSARCAAFIRDFANASRDMVRSLSTLASVGRSA
jgi:hypothetical protein